MLYDGDIILNTYCKQLMVSNKINKSWTGGYQCIYVIVFYIFNLLWYD